MEAWRVIAGLRHEPVALILDADGRYRSWTERNTRRRKGYGAGPMFSRKRMTAGSQILLLATGSEVELCVDAYETLKDEEIKARVVSMPSWEMSRQHYCRDHPDYREQVLPSAVRARVSVEKGSTLGWSQYVGMGGHSVGMETFGASAPLKELQKRFGFTAENVVRAAKRRS